MSLNKVLNTTYTGVYQGIEDFLAKPIVLQQGTFGPGDTYGTFPNVSLFRDIFVKPIYQNKISGFFGFKATTHFRLLVNGNKFQQGRYILAFLPSGGIQTPSLQDTNWLNSHVFTACTVTQLPHVELDISCNTEVVLTIPFISTETMWSIPLWNRTVTSMDIGKVIIYPYSPLVSPTGTTTASYSLYVHFTDVVLTGPSFPQSEWKPNISDKEAKLKNAGPVEQSLKLASRSFSVLSQIPLLSMYAGTASWALNIGSSVASIFGWSKNHLQSTEIKNIRSMMPYMGNVDGGDTSFRLTFSKDHLLDVLPGYGGTDLDEMSFKFISQVPAYLDRLTWTDVTATGTQLAGYLVNPTGSVTSFDGGVGLSVPIPCAFIASMFQLWRGSICFRFKIVKTSFHSGRLIVSYAPGDGRSGLLLANINESEWLHRSIIDIREGYEFTLRIPYLSTRPYMKIGELDGSTGRLTVAVLDPLTRPASVSSSVTILVEKFAGPDFEVAGPKNITEFPIIPSAPQSEWRPDCTILSEDIGGSKPTPSIDFSRMCIGENVMSLRSLLKTFGYKWGTSTAVNSVTRMRPWFIDNFLSTGVAVFKPTYAPDYYTYIAPLFALARGGFRMKVEPYNDTGFTAYESKTSNYLLNLPDGTATPTSSISEAAGASYTSGGIGPNFQVNTSFTGCTELEIGNYLSTYARANAELMFNNTTITSNGYTHFPKYTVESAMDSGSTRRYFRSLSDDGDMSVFVSTVPIHN